MSTTELANIVPWSRACLRHYIATAEDFKSRLVMRWHASGIAPASEWSSSPSRPPTGNPARPRFLT
eukprot:5254239-Pyramimonas_sp.AAC.1